VDTIDDRRRRARTRNWWSGATRSARTVVVVVFLITLVATVVAVHAMPGDRTVRWWVVLPVLWAATTVSMRRATTAGLHRGSSEVVVIPVGQYIFAAAVLLDPIWLLVLAICVPSMRPGLRAIGARCNRLLTMLAGSATFWTLWGDGPIRLLDGRGWRLLWVSAVTMLVHTLVETVLVSISVRFTFGTRLREMNIWNLYSFGRDLWEVSIGALGAILAVTQPALLLLLVPVAELAVEHVRLEREVIVARRDPRTNLFNVRGFDELSSRELAMAAHSSSALSLLVLDLDHLRDINNQHGHRAGDAVISEIGARLQRVARKEDVVARIGGEEFVALLPDVALANAIAIGERIRSDIEATPVETPAGSVPITISIGVAQWDGNETMAHLFDRADTAMYRAKQAGRNQVMSDGER